MLSSLGVIDSLLTSVVADNRWTKTKHLSNKESIGQGSGNIISGFGGTAGAGATMRTVVNIQSGGKTPIFRFDFIL